LGRLSLLLLLLLLLYCGYEFGLLLMLASWEWW
jgi:hypothetical protein